MAEKRVAILDRDGTIIVERHYLSEPAQVELIPGAAEGLRQLRKLGLGLLVVTNQSGIGRRYFDERRLDLIHQRFADLLAAEGVTLDGIYYCPHTPEDDCLCRKPRTRMVERASQDHRFDPSLSFVIGDNSCDVELGRNVGATTILVKTGYGSQVGAKGLTPPDYVANDLLAAAGIVTRLMATNRRESPAAALCQRS